MQWQSEESRKILSEFDQDNELKVKTGIGMYLYKVEIREQESHRAVGEMEYFIDTSNFLY